MTSQTPETWFAPLISRSLAALYLLNLDGCPAADALDKTAKLWVKLLWEKPRSGWDEEKDNARIRKAFFHIANTAKRWPSPTVFWECLEDRAPPKKEFKGDGQLEPEWGRERQTEALEAMDAWCRSLGIDRWGNPLEGTV